MLKWQEELMSFKGTKNTFIIEGNTNDRYPITDENGDVKFKTLNQVILDLFNKEKNTYNFLFCNPIFGFTDVLGLGNVSESVSAVEKILREDNRFSESLNPKAPKEEYGRSFACSEIVRTILTKCVEGVDEVPAVVLNYAQHFLSSTENPQREEYDFFLNLLYATENAVRYKDGLSTLILVVQKASDIPLWFYHNNPNVKILSVPSPDRSTRISYIDHIFNCFDNNDEETAKAKTRFIDLTDKMKLVEISELKRLAENSDIAPENICDVISLYKYGIRDNPWQTIKEKFKSEDTDLKERLLKRVKGQDEVLSKVVPIIKRSVTGLSGLQHSSDGKPKGIFFLAGPTGTGKTELVKAITELIFEDENRLLRFDMSEFSAEHSDQKLFGAPPGYVGYSNGGQLTNAVKKEPFSVILFDEIEKAHPSILDKFLQILEDGRMTDGQGTTVYFTECMIFFTSNIGIYDYEYGINGRIISKERAFGFDEAYESIFSKVKNAMQKEFKQEFINRIGDNLFVFRYIDNNASESIASAMLEKINTKIHRRSGISIRLGDDAIDLIYHFCKTDDVKEHGGRGIGNAIESSYINSLADFIYDADCSEGDVIVVEENEGRLIFKKE